MWNDYVLVSALFNIALWPSNLNIQKHPDASNFRNHGWEYYEEMSTILPSRTTSNYTFSAQTHAAISTANVSSSLSGGSSSPPGSHDDAAHHVQDNVQPEDEMRVDTNVPIPMQSAHDNAFNNNAPPTSFAIHTTPPILSPNRTTPTLSPNRTTPSTRSARLSVTPLSTSTHSPARHEPRVTSPLSGSPARSSRITGSQALQEIGEVMRSEADIRCSEADMRRAESDARLQATEVRIKLDEARIVDLQKVTDQRPPSARAIELFSRVDAASFSPQALMAMYDIFDTDANQATNYLAMESSDIFRRTWIQRQLMRLNPPSFVYSTVDQPDSSGFPSGSSFGSS